MTTPESEPTLTDVLAAIQSLAVKVDGVDAKADALSEKLDAHQLATAARFDLLDARHTEHAQALEAIAGLVHGQQHEIARSEARITSRIADVQGVVQSLKADLAAHVSDTALHRAGHGEAA